MSGRAPSDPRSVRIESHPARARDNGAETSPGRWVGRLRDLAAIIVCCLRAQISTFFAFFQQPSDIRAGGLVSSKSGSGSGSGRSFSQGSAGHQTAADRARPQLPSCRKQSGRADKIFRFGQASPDRGRSLDVQSARTANHLTSRGREAAAAAAALADPAYHLLGAPVGVPFAGAPARAEPHLVRAGSDYHIKGSCRGRQPIDSCAGGNPGQAHWLPFRRAAEVAEARTNDNGERLVWRQTKQTLGRIPWAGPSEPVALWLARSGGLEARPETR